MQNQWQVRPAEAGDAEALSLIGGATFLETFAGILDGAAIVAHCKAKHSTEFYSAALGGHGMHAWLAQSGMGHAPIGFALVGRPDLPGSEEGDVELKRIYALSRFHGAGLGSELLRQVIARAEKSGRRLLLGVYAGNSRAIAFYRKQGFQEIADRRFDVGGTLYDDIVFARALA